MAHVLKVIRIHSVIYDLSNERIQQGMRRLKRNAVARHGGPLAAFESQALLPYHPALIQPLPVAAAHVELLRQVKK